MRTPAQIEASRRNATLHGLRAQTVPRFQHQNEAQSNEADQPAIDQLHHQIDYTTGNARAYRQALDNLNRLSENQFLPNEPKPEQPGPEPLP